MRDVPPDDEPAPSVEPGRAPEPGAHTAPPEVRRVVEQLTDGEWHRLHWASPLLKGGIAFVAILAFVLANLRERLVELLIGQSGGPTGPSDAGDPIAAIYDRGYTGIAVLIVIGVLLLAIAAFAVAWRMHTFRIGDDAVEVRSGVVFRHNRQARLDRIQGIHITRPLLARLFGAARIELNVAGQDAKVELSYLGSRQVDELRREILRRASGVQHAAAQTVALPESAATGSATAAGSDPAPGVSGAEVAALGSAAAPSGVWPEGGLEAETSAALGASGTGVAPAPGSAPGSPSVEGAAVATTPRGSEAGILNRRVRELLDAELDPATAPPESVVRISPLRLLGSLVVSEFTVVLLLVIAALFFSTFVLHRYFILFLLLPSVLGSLGYYVRRFSKSVRYSIAATPDGVRVGFGLLTTNNDTLPPGRIHAIEVTQPILWRPFGWWMIRINRAGHASGRSGASAPHTLLLPVGRIADVEKVLALLLPGLAGARTQGLVLEGLTARGRRGRRADAARRAGGAVSNASILPGTGPVGELGAGLEAGPVGVMAGGEPVTGSVHAAAVDTTPPAELAAFSAAPRRAQWLRPFSWRRTGMARTSDAVLLRSGFFWRRLTVLPLARLQSVRVSQGPVRRMLDLAELHFTTIAGPVRAELGVIGRVEGLAAFTEVSAAAVDALRTDRSHRWAS